MAARLWSRALDSDELLAECLSNVAAWEPRVRALVDEPGREARLRAEVDRIRRRWPDPAARPPLFGVPVGAKDLFVVDGLATRAGSRLPPEEFAGPEATVVARLRAAGAIVLAKTTTDEFAYSAPPPTRNPHDLARSPGGSSAGSAAGVACGMFPLALGTQTSRSIVAPAAYCGVLGFKPSHGRVPTDGVVALSPFFDVPGLLASDATGLALAVGAIVDGRRGVAAPPRVLGVPSGAYLRGLPDLGWREPFDGSLRALRAAGFEVRDVRLPWDDDLEGVYRLAMDVLHAEMALVHRERFARHDGLYAERTRQGIERGQGVDAATLARGRARGLALREEVSRAMREAGVGLLLSPSQPGPPPPLGGATGSGSTTTPWSFAGLPCASVPAGSITGLPFGLQGIAPYGDDEELLAWVASLPALP